MTPAVPVSYQKRIKNPGTECEQMNGRCIENAAEFAGMSNERLEVLATPTIGYRTTGGLMKNYDPRRSQGRGSSIGLNE